MTRLLTTWNPWDELQRVRADFGRLLPLRWRFSQCEPNAVPSVNVRGNDEVLVVTAEIPGIEADALDVTVTANSVTIRAGYPEREIQEGETWLLRERPRGRFERTLELPFEVDSDKAEATFENGVLTLTLHRPEAHKPKKVAIKTA